MLEGTTWRGIEPDGARHVATLLAGMEDELSRASQRVRALLQEAGIAVATDAPIRMVAAGCAEAAADLRRRAEQAEEDAGEAGRGLLLLPGLGSGVPPTGVLSRVLALLGARHDPGLALAFPALADRRRRAAGVVVELLQRRQKLAAEVERCALTPVEAARREKELGLLIAAQRRRAIATAAEMEALLRPLPDEQVRRLGAELARLLPTLGADERDRAALARALAPLRDRLEDQLGPVAADLYTRRARDGQGAFELAGVIQALELRPVERGGNALSAFVGGLVAGDADQRGHRSSWLEAWRQVGHTVSGLVAVGDLRDAAAGLIRGDWEGTAWSMAGLIPIAGDAGKAARNASNAAEAAAAVARATRRISLGNADLERRVDDAIERARIGKIRFYKHDGKPFDNWDDLIPVQPEGYYTEWTAADNGKPRQLDRVIVGGDPRNPDVIFYWDHDVLYLQIYP